MFYLFQIFVRSKEPTHLDCKFNFHLNVPACQLPFLLAEAVQCSDHPFYENCGIYKGSTRTLHRATLRGQIPAFVCDTLKRVSQKQATKVDYNRLRPCKPFFWYNSMQR